VSADELLAAGDPAVDNPRGTPERCAPATDAPPLAVPDELADILRQYTAVTARLQQTHLALQQEVARLRLELASKDRELELRRRLAALGELAAGVAHEVRNPLGAIQLYSGLLRNECRSRKLTQALQLIDKIEAGIQAIEAVVQDTLALAPRDRQLALCNLREVVERVCVATAHTVAACDVRLEVILPEAELCVRADPAGLQRVLVNLVTNAAEASPPGRTVWLEVAALTAQPDGSANESAPNGSNEPTAVELRVRDEGPGLPEELRHRIFDPFFTTKQHGTGLGLTIAHRLTEAYGGRLRAENRPAGGAEFIVTLPLAREGPAEEQRQFSAA